MDELIQQLVAAGLSEADARRAFEAAGLTEAGARHARVDLTRLREILRLVHLVIGEDKEAADAAKAELGKVMAGEGAGDAAQSSEVAGATETEGAADEAAERQVTLDETHEPLSESSVLLEAVEPDGSVVDVLVIQAGTSANRRRYRPEVLREAVEAGKFDGAKAFWSDGADHDRARRGVRALCGWWDNARFGTFSVPAKGGGTRIAEGVAAHFHPTDASLRSTLRSAIAGGRPDLIGFSIFGDGPTRLLRETAGPLLDVERIDVIDSVDPVMHPAAGGQALRLVASKEGPTMNWSTLTLAEAVKALAAGTITADDLKVNRGDLAEAIAAGKITEAAPAPATPDVAALVESALAPMRTASLVESVLAEHRGLPVAAQARIREATKGRALDEAAVRKLVEAEAAYVATLNPAIVRNAGAASASDMRSEGERLVEAAVDLLTPGRGGSIRQFYVDLTGDRNFTGKLQESGRLTSIAGGLSESISVSTFPAIMLDAMHKRLLAEYQMPGLDDWRLLCSAVGPLNDFRTVNRVRMGGYGNLPTVAERGTYTALSTPSDVKATFAPSKKGGTEDLSLETIVNDDLSQMRRIPVKLARAAANTLREFVFDLLRTNAVITTDGLALFHATHGNLGSTALSSAALTAARLAMRKQAELGSAKRIGIVPKYLWVPADLEQTAYEILVPAIAQPTTAFVQAINVTPKVVDYWTDVTDWFLSADPASVETIEVGFLNNQQDPELLLQDQPNIGDNFVKDVLTYKIRHIYGGAVLDHRGFFGAIVAG